MHPLAGFTELRIHGVSGTPPTSMLRTPHVCPVAGDRRAGFFRAADAHHRCPDPAGTPGETERVEAYSWGGLTSGSARRALWLLLLPFMLVNVAHWTHPVVRADETGLRRSVRSLVGPLVRLFALTLTVTLVLAAAVLGMDLATGQCAAQYEQCASDVLVLRHVNGSWFDGPGERAALGGLLPFAVVLLLWVLGSVTWKSYEEFGDAVDARTAGEVPLARPRFWASSDSVRRLRRLHIASGFATVTALVAGVGIQHDTRGTRWVGSIIVGTAVGLLVVCAVGVCLRRVGERAELETVGPSLAAATVEEAVTAWTPVSRLVRLLATALCAGAAAYAMSAAGSPVDGPHQVPLLRQGVDVLFAGQAVLLALMTLAVGASRPRARVGDAAPAFGGYATPALAMLGWLVACAFSAGIAFRAADWLGIPVTDAEERVARAAEFAQQHDATLPLAARIDALDAPAGLIISPSYQWAGVGSVGGAALLVTLLVVVWRARKRSSAACLDEVLRDYAKAGDPAALARAKAVARMRATAALTDSGERWVAKLLAASTVLVVAGVVVTFLEVAPPRQLVSAGAWAVGGFAAGLVAVGLAAYRQPGLRRTVGILWDVGTFWPRAAHPLAPPCYAERTVPQLVRRFDAVPQGGSVLFSAHSQGSVIAAATLLQLDERSLRRWVALLTYGSPLWRLYARVFPAYFGPATLGRLERLLDRSSDPAQREIAWHNLYRLSDPIGGWVRANRDRQPGVLDDRVDSHVLDPDFDTPSWDTVPPTMRGHSDYEDSPVYAEAVTRLRGRLRPREP